MKRKKLMALATFDGAAGTENMSMVVLRALARDYNVTLWSISCLGHFFETLESHLSSIQIFSQGKFSGVKNAARLAFSIIVHRPAIVMVFDYKMAIELAMALSWLPRFSRPFSVFCHHVQLQHRLVHAPRRERERARKLFTLFDVHTVPSTPVADELLESVPLLKKESVQLIANGINISLLHELAKESMAVNIQEAQFHCVCLGGLRTDKHVDDVLSSFSQLAQFSDTILLVIGDGPERGKLENLAKSLNIEKRCLFLGEVANPHPYLARASMLIHISDRETFGLAALEAMAHGTPVLAMCKDVRGIATVLQNGLQGILIDDYDLPTFTQQWQLLLADDEALKRMGNEGVKRAELFDEKNMVEHFRNLLTDKGKPS
ncbi:MAG: glycosyltransferase [Ghiorsea sp.]